MPSIRGDVKLDARSQHVSRRLSEEIRRAVVDLAALLTEHDKDPDEAALAVAATLHRYAAELTGRLPTDLPLRLVLHRCPGCGGALADAGPAAARDDHRAICCTECANAWAAPDDEVEAQCCPSCGSTEWEPVRPLVAAICTGCRRPAYMPNLSLDTYKDPMA